MSVSFSPTSQTPGPRRHDRWSMAMILFLAIVASLILGVTMYWILRSKRLEPPQPIPISIATSNNIWCALTLVALDRQLFAAEGLAAQVSINAAGRLNMDALTSESVDAANVVDVNLAYQAFNQNANLFILGSIVRSDDQEVVARKSSGIVTQRDLRGKRVGYAAGTSAEPFLAGMLASHGLTHDSVQPRRVPPTNVVQQLIAKEVDAIATWQPFVSSAKKALGPDAVSFSGGGWYRGSMFLAVRRDWAGAHRLELQRLANVYRRAAKFVADSQEVSQRIVAKATGIDEGELRTLWGRFQFEFAAPAPDVKAIVDSIVENARRSEPSVARKVPLPVASYFLITPQ